MSTSTFPVTGTCQCGNVRLTLLAPPLKVMACHCRECQKLSTSVFSITALVQRDDLRVEGELKDWQRSSDSGNINAAKFCPHCGNRIYHYNPATPELVKLKPAILDDTSFLKPTAHVWVSEKPPWYNIPEGVEVFDRQP